MRTGHDCCQHNYQSQESSGLEVDEGIATPGPGTLMRGQNDLGEEINCAVDVM